MKKLMTICILCGLIFSTACTYKEEFEKSDSDLGSRDETAVRNEIKAYGFQMDRIDHHQINEMKMDMHAANEVTRMDGVRTSYVLLTDTNAYVSIMVDNSATGTSARGNVRADHNAHKSNNMIEQEIKELKAKPPYYVNDITRRYTIPNPHDISSKLKQNIAKVVRSLHPEVQEVYVSANEHFNNQLNIFAQKIRLGESLDAEDIEGFQTMAKSHFIE